MIVTLSLKEQTLKYNREVVRMFSARALIFLRTLCFKCSLFNDLIPVLPGGGGGGGGRQNTHSHVYSLPF